MLVSPWRNQSNSWIIDLIWSFFVVKRGKPFERSNRIWYPKILIVPVPVLSVFLLPSVRIFLSSFWYSVSKELILAVFLKSGWFNFCFILFEILVYVLFMLGLYLCLMWSQYFIENKKGFCIIDVVLYFLSCNASTENWSYKYCCWWIKTN